MAKDFLMDLAFENLSKCMGSSDWKESDEVILFSIGNKEQIKSDEKYRETEICQYYGKRICIFCKQLKKNNYITLHKNLLEKMIETMELFTDEENTEEK